MSILTKTCTKCNKTLQLESFSKKGSGFQSHCKSCVSDRYKAWYSKNKPKEVRRVIRNNRRIQSENRVKLLQYLLAHPCTCGESDPIVLQFHHLRDKKYDIGFLMSSSYGWNTIQKEINKCVVLCSNCHDRVTAKEQGNWKIAALAQLDRALVL